MHFAIVLLYLLHGHSLPEKRRREGRQTSVAAKWLLREADTDRALELRRRIKTGETIALAPDLIFAETANVLRKQVSFFGLDPQMAEIMLAAFLKVPIQSTPSASLAASAMRLAFQCKRSPYDCLFLALSLSVSAPLVTADEAFLNCVRHRFPTVLSLDSAVQ